MMNKFISAILAGLCISIGGIVNMSVGGGIIGAILFTFGLIAVVHYRYSLYTGTAGFVDSRKDFSELFYVILIGNVIGCILSGVLVCEALPDIAEKAQKVVYMRNETTLLSSIIRGFLCGVLMTAAVKFARDERWLPLLWAVPVFILSGFYHSIADAFYMSAGYKAIEPYTCYVWLSTVFGNFIGCNLYRINNIF